MTPRRVLILTTFGLDEYVCASRSRSAFEPWIQVAGPARAASGIERQGSAPRSGSWACSSSPCSLCAAPASRPGRCRRAHRRAGEDGDRCHRRRALRVRSAWYAGRTTGDGRARATRVDRAEAHGPGHRPFLCALFESDLRGHMLPTSVGLVLDGAEPGSRSLELPVLRRAGAPGPDRRGAGSFSRHMASGTARLHGARRTLRARPRVS